MASPEFWREAASNPPRVHFPPTPYPEVARLQVQLGARLDRARLRALELDSEVADWRHLQPLRLETVIDQDRHGWGLRLHVEHEADLTSWGLTFGEAIHHLRSALDTTLVTLAKVEGLAPKRRLQYPIVTDEKDWADQRKRHLREVPSWVWKPVYAAQPFLSDSPSRHPLARLNDFDNDNKHRTPSVGTVLPAELEHDFTPVLRSGRSVGPARQLTYDLSLADGSMLLHERVGDEEVEGVMGDLWWSADIGVEDRQGKYVPSVDFYQEAEKAVQDACAMLLAVWEGRLAGEGPFVTQPGDSFRRRKPDGAKRG
ncbi:hypothetical protein [Curtobacterium sp. MCPF17_051]|uniref:hypothetical protein n=1 Tax=Curtobacterium sp. MCPF17_051 TaxID=2175640 RepID=UPI0011B54F26|nr:hypothetical protein [Curtobacterium sp. MCPF17_051]